MHFWPHCGLFAHSNARLAHDVFLCHIWSNLAIVKRLSPDRDHLIGGPSHAYRAYSLLRKTNYVNRINTFRVMLADRHKDKHTNTQTHKCTTFALPSGCDCKEHYSTKTIGNVIPTTWPLQNNYNTARLQRERTYSVVLSECTLQTSKGASELLLPSA